jgi:hypothetical protein
VKQIKAQLRIADEQAVRNHPDLLESGRIWTAYAKQVNAVAFAQGEKEPAFVRRVRELLAERADAESVGEDGGVRSAERRLECHTGIPYPQLPAAAWETADLLPSHEREAEYERLAKKYGPRGKSDTKSRGRVRAAAPV